MRGGSGDSQLTQWKKKHQKELDEFRKLSGDKFTLRQWRKEKKKESILNLYHISKKW